MKSRKSYIFVLLVALIVIFLPCAAVYAVDLKAGDILFSSIVFSPDGNKDGVFRLDSLTGATPIFYTPEICDATRLKDMAFGPNGELFLLLDCNSILPDIAELDPATGTLSPVLENNLLFRTHALIPDRAGNLLIFCQSELPCMASLFPEIRGDVLRVNPASGVVTSVVDLDTYERLQDFASVGLAMDQQGHLLFAGYDGRHPLGKPIIVTFDPANSTAEVFATVKRLQYISDIAIDNAGYIYVGGSLPESSDGTYSYPPKGAVVRINPEHSGDQTVFTNFHPNPIYPWDSVRKITVDRNGDLLVTSGRGIIRLTPAGDQMLLYNTHPLGVPPPMTALLPDAIAVVPESGDCMPAAFHSFHVQGRAATDPCQVSMKSVKFKKINSPLDANPGNGEEGTAVGLRIFPDKNTPEDTTPRNTVLVVAQVDPPQPGISVFFKSFDVDDPSSDTNPIDPYGSKGNDNWGTPHAGALKSMETVTDANGSASVRFTVTMQPGDNFRVVASLDKSIFERLKVDGIKIIDSSNGTSLPTLGAGVTEVLTVWRRLHIEVDSMGPVTGNQVKGVIKRPGILPSRLWLQNELPDAINRFQHGSLRVAATTAEFQITGVSTGAGEVSMTVNGIRVAVSPQANLNAKEIADALVNKAKQKGYKLTRFGNKWVVASVNGKSPIRAARSSTDQDVTITGNVFTRDDDVFEVLESGKSYVDIPLSGMTRKNDSFGHPLPFGGYPYTLVDDDDFNGNDGQSLKGDEGEDVSFPDLSLVQDSDDPTENVFAAAYVRPKYDIGDNNDSVPFIINIPGYDEQMLPLYDFDAKETEADPDFWTVYLLGAYQAVTTHDNDPGSPHSKPTIRLGQADAFRGQGVMVFLEAFGPNEIQSIAKQCHEFYSAAITVAHEIGHLFEGHHEDGGIMAQTCSRHRSKQFSKVTLAIIRKGPHP